MYRSTALITKFRDALAAPDPLASLIEEPAPGVFTFDAFTKAFCNGLLKELSKHEDKQEAPNSMNRYGLVLKDIGMGNLCEDILSGLVNPLVRRFYPSIGKLKRYHGFIVNYEPKKQAKLNLHYDESVITLNVCLGYKFTGGDLLLHDDDGRLERRIKQHVGQAILHPGEQQHAAAPVRSGKRSNLILWCSR